ncbi:peptidyl-tRNA hydrolase Pth2 [Candidatus Nanohalobium constans]|uniref:Peptidyl-tRNA hydrolase n=1 Tax=Candidatus Nanohalobium constans TaxID=2565781 RepID=A0A5Q0UEX7_9ARCH|nr:peptidyl-tRNA hydrolase Pth2 [Candidatus Nanohalobium constans]QGA80107.1 peptidyl-tRNA hydrolase, PTH2 family [Candidatus Nanohalobium constans]
MSELKQVIVLRSDLDMSTGKMIAQASHASLKAYKKADDELRADWESQGGKKVALKAGEDTFQEKLEEAKTLQVPAALITDAGHTEVQPGTNTALGIGPATSDKIDQITGELKLIK